MAKQKQKRAYNFTKNGVAYDLNKKITVAVVVDKSLHRKLERKVRSKGTTQREFLLSILQRSVA
jgi:hypothetical protein